MRIELLDSFKHPQNATKFVGYILVHDQGVIEMLRLAYTSTHVLQSLIAQVKGKCRSFLESNHASYPEKGPLAFQKLVTNFAPFVQSSSSLEDQLKSYN